MYETAGAFPIENSILLVRSLRGWSFFHFLNSFPNNRRKQRLLAKGFNRYREPRSLQHRARRPNVQMSNRNGRLSTCSIFGIFGSRYLSDPGDTTSFLYVCLYPQLPAATPEYCTQYYDDRLLDLEYIGAFPSRECRQRNSRWIRKHFFTVP